MMIFEYHNRPFNILICYWILKISYLLNIYITAWWKLYLYSVATRQRSFFFLPALSKKKTVKSSQYRSACSKPNQNIHKDTIKKYLQYRIFISYVSSILLKLPRSIDDF